MICPFDYRKETEKTKVFSVSFFLCYLTNFSVTKLLLVLYIIQKKLIYLDFKNIFMIRICVKVYPQFLFPLKRGE